MSSLDESVAPKVNIASALASMARKVPYRPAVVFPAGRDSSGRVTYTHYTFDQLDKASDVIARGLRDIGIGPGVRTVLMVTPSLEFFALVFALFKTGAVLVLVDPGIGIKNLGVCLGEAQPTAFVGIPKAHVARLLLGWARRTLKITVTVGGPSILANYTLAAIKERGAKLKGPASANTNADDTAAILFTSGSTGVPKGAVYTHGMFAAQVESIRKIYAIEPGEIDLPTFPLFALFDPALGMTAIIPDMDFTRPGQVNPRKIVEAIENFGVTNMFGSPALINRVGRFGEAHGLHFPTLRRVISAGAPVAASVIERFTKLLSEHAQVMTPYGATESLPVTSIGSHDILTETRFRTDEGAGVCVGKPVPGMDVRVIPITDLVIDHWNEDLPLPAGQIGEIVVSGPVVTHEYYNRPKSTALAKIIDGPSRRIFHRMGDVGYFDSSGRLWFCGRKSHRVVTAEETLFTIPCEAVFNVHPQVFRTALVGVKRSGGAEPVLCVELEANAKGISEEKLKAELLALGNEWPHTSRIKTILVYPKSFPVDIRHNAKIFREKLAVWAEKKLA